MRLMADKRRGLEDLPFLSEMAARMRFAPISERWIEAQHAITKRYMANAPHITAGHVAFHGIQLQLRSLLTRRPETLHDLAGFASHCHNPVKCLKAMGLFRHPAVQKLVQQVRFKDLNRAHSPALTEVLYHVDAFSLHAPLPSEDDGDHESDGMDGPPLPPGPPPRPPSGHPPTPGPAGSSADRVEVEHRPGGEDASAAGGEGHGSHLGSVGSASAPPAPGAGDTGTASDLPAGAPPRVSTGVTSGSSPPLGGPSKSAGGCLHDDLWCKAAMDFLRVWLRGQALNGIRPFLSIGPKLSRHPSEYVASLSSVLHLAVGLASAPVFDFAGDAPGGCPPAAQAAPADEVVDAGARFEQRLGRMLFFSVQKDNPHAVTVPRHAPKVTDSGSLAVNIHDVHSFDRKSRKVKVLLEDAGGKALDPHLLSSSWMTTDDFSTLAHWESSEPLHFDIGIGIEEGLQPTFQDAIGRLLQAHSEVDEGNRFFMLFATSDPDGATLSCLWRLAQRELVDMVGQDATSTSWAFTTAGASGLRATQVLINPRTILPTKPSTPVKEASAFELASLLRNDGWVCTVKGVGRRRRRRAAPARAALQPSNPPEPVDYAPGGEKRWWLVPSQRVFRVKYMRALLMTSSGDIQGPVPHFKTERYYDCLIAGVAFEPARRRPRFVFEGEVEVEPRRRRRPQKRARHEVRHHSRGEVGQVADNAPCEEEGEDEEVQGLEAEAEEEDEDLFNEVFGDRSSDSGDDPGQGSGGESAVAAEASSSSASSSASSASGADGAARAPVQSQGGTGGRLIDTTQMWKGFKFTEVKSNSIVVGLEAMCYRHPCASRCTRTLRFARHGGRPNTEHKLKWWAAAGWGQDVQDSRAHMCLPKTPANLPSLESLEAAAQPPPLDS